MRFRKIALILSIAVLFSFDVSAKPKTAKYYENMYSFAKKMKEKRDLVKRVYKDIGEGEGENYAPLISKIIDEQYNYGVEQDKNSFKDYEEWIYYTAMCAGALKLNNKAAQLKTIYTYVKSPIYLGTIAHVLALTGAKDEVLPWLNEHLREMNMMVRKGSGGIGYKEEIVEGILLGMKEFKDLTSFEHVFFATVPNYSERIREIAREVLTEITDNPAPQIATFINAEDDFSIVRELLAYAHKSSSSNEDKEKLYLSVLDRCLGQMVENNQENLAFKPKAEQDVVFYLGEIKATSAEATKLIGEKWKADNKDKSGVSEDTNVKLINIEALRKIATPEASKVLLENLRFYYTAGKAGFGTGYGTKEGNKIFIAIIRALSEIGNSDEDIIMQLELIKNADEFGMPVIHEAEKALEKL
ncbi:MAG: hypothetical protein UHW86_00915 [Spirochaetota bacterium]|jgi:hypothetical protein|nr:hypothetical protein [Spirochaetota bacterium]